MKGRKQKMNNRENMAAGTAAPLSAEVRVGGEQQAAKKPAKSVLNLNVDSAIASVLARRSQRLARAQQQMAAPGVVQETIVPDAAVEAFIAVEEEIARIEGEISDLRGDTALSSRSVASLVNAKQAELNSAQAERELVVKTFPTVAKLATSKMGPVTEARELRKALKSLATGRVRGEDVAAHVIRWSEAGLVIDDPNGLLSWRIGGSDHTLGCAFPENATIVEAFADLVAFVTGWQRDSKARAAKSAEPVQKFLIPTDEFDGIKASSARIIPFLMGEPGDNMCLVFIEYPGERGPEKFGDVLLEHIGGDLVVRKVARSFAAMRFFGSYSQDTKNPKSGHRVWKEKGPIKTPFPLLVEVGEGQNPPRFDLASIASPELRYAIEAKIAADWQYKVRGDRTREFFGEIEDISSIDPELLVTSEELRHGRCKPGNIAVVRVAWETRGSDRRLHGRIDLKVLPGGRSFQIVNMVPEDLAKKVEWLAGSTSAAIPLHELDTPRWLAARRQGAKFERNVFAGIAVARFSAQLLTKDNVEALAGIKGGDGTYVISHEFLGSRAKHSTPVLYVVKKLGGGKITILWALPGVSERSVRDDIAQVYEMDALPRTIRGAIRNQLRFFKGWGGGDVGMSKVREQYPHLLTEVAEADDA